MTLRRRLLVHISLTAAGAMLLAAGVLVGVDGLRQDFGVALRANGQLRRVYEVGTHVAAAKRWLGETPANPARAGEELRAAMLKLDGVSDGGREAKGAGKQEGGAGALDEEDAARIRELLRGASADVALMTEMGAASEGTAAAVGRVPALDQALAAIAALSAETRTTIAARQSAADAKHRLTQAAVVGLFAVMGVGVVVAGVRLYRAVMTPVSRLGETARRIAAGDRGRRATSSGDAEFVSLAKDFNSMAAELDGLLASLERQVAAKSKELVRSERLASVGYLAAGVAHEINNPLGIIAGYGERSLQHLRRAEGGPVDPATGERIRKAIEVMCEEAFRCKAITDRLLSLARPGADGSKPVNLAALATEIVSTVGALGDFADRVVSVETGVDAGEELWVSGRDAELKQVVLNLVINALQAVSPHHGRVQVTLRRDGERVELSVADNGRGIPATTLEHVFEPFFSDRGRGVERGTGLGLSITHAIVADHGGTIRVESDGAGCGSRFVVILPACDPAPFVRSEEQEKRMATETPGHRGALG